MGAPTVTTVHAYYLLCVNYPQWTRHVNIIEGQAACNSIWCLVFFVNVPHV